MIGILGFMQEFYAKTGNHKLRFKPAYNPYTEVSYNENCRTSQLTLVTAQYGGLFMA